MVSESDTGILLTAHISMPDLHLKNLKVISTLGRGAKGVVFLVQTQIGQLLALKAISRSLKTKNMPTAADYRRIFFERDVLASVDHPLLPKLHGVLLTDKIVGYAIDYCPGRDLHSLRKMQTEKMFSEDVIRFYAAELVLALEYLHSLGIVYRDLKPENVMVQENGHLMLVDFDLSTKLSPKSSEPIPKIKLKKKKKRRFGCFFKAIETEITPEDLEPESESVEKSKSFVGTEEYVAPEIISGEGHEFAVDWWCLGIVLYEMLYGTTPFRGSNRKETFYRVLTKAPNLTGNWTPLRDLIAKLLDKNPNRRISFREIQAHQFFRGVDWDLITEIPRPPFIPELTDVEAKEGNREFDVEKFVQKVFNEENNNEGKANSGDYNNHPTEIQDDSFLVF